jgi:YVTN family beta-propeller protein
MDATTPAAFRVGGRRGRIMTVRTRIGILAAVLVALMAGSSGRAASTHLHIVASIPHKGVVGGMVFGASSLWAADVQHTAILRIDPKTNRILARVPIGKPLNFVDDQDQVDGWVAVGDGFVWATDQSHNRVVRINPATNRVVASIRVASPWDIAVSDGAVWVPQFEPYAVARIDEATNTVAKRIPATGPTAVAAGAGSIWVVMHRADEVIRINPQTNTVVATIPLRQATSPERAFFLFGSLWVSDGNETHALLRINPATNRVVAVIKPPGSFFANFLFAGGRWLWDVSPAGGVYKIDPATNRIVEQAHFDPPAKCGAPPAPQPCFFGAGYADGTVWAYDQLKQAIIRISD